LKLIGASAACRAFAIGLHGPMSDVALGVLMQERDAVAHGLPHQLELASPAPAQLMPASSSLNAGAAIHKKLLQIDDMPSIHPPQNSAALLLRNHFRRRLGYQFATLSLGGSQSWSWLTILQFCAAQLAAAS